MTTNRRLIHTRPRSYCGVHACEVWHFYRDERGVYAECGIDEWKLTEAERAEHQAHEAAMQAYHDATAGRDEFDEPQDRIHFPTLLLAIRHAKLEDEEVNIHNELHAFHAPGECAELAYSSLRRRREALMGWTVHALGL